LRYATDVLREVVGEGVQHSVEFSKLSERVRYHIDYILNFDYCNGGMEKYRENHPTTPE
jgi:hypothetical protein